jgi:hypothetical protein
VSTPLPITAIRPPLVALAAATALALAMAAPGSAVAADAARGGYSGPNGQVLPLEEEHGSGGGPDARGSAARGSSDDGASLPFTGTDLAVLAVAGGFLVSIGLGLRRLTARAWLDGARSR